MVHSPVKGSLGLQRKSTGENIRCSCKTRVEYVGYVAPHPVLVWCEVCEVYQYWDLKEEPNHDMETTTRNG